MKRFLILAGTVALVICGVLGFRWKGNSSASPIVPQLSKVEIESRLASLQRHPLYDPVNGRVIFPADDFFIQDNPVYGAYIEAQIAVCARKKFGADLKVEYPRNRPLIDSAWNNYGPWTYEIAKEFGFTHPNSGEGRIRPPDPPIMSYSEEVRHRIDVECDESIYESINLPGYPAEFIEVVSSGDVSKDPRAIEVNEELSVCIREKGLSPSSHGNWGLLDNSTVKTYNDEQAELAVQVVECKEKVNFTQRIAELQAEQQVRIIEKYAPEIFAVKAYEEDLMRRAEEYIRDHQSIFISPPQRGSTTS